MKWKEGGQFEEPPPGLHIARCTALIDLGTQTHSFNNETWQSRDVRIVWELPTLRMTGKYNEEQKGRVFQVALTLKQSMHTSAKLRKLLTSWRGRAFTQEELTAFDPKKMIGKPCRLNLIANGDKVRIDGVFQLGEGETCPKQINPPLYFSLDPAEYEAKVYDKLSQNTREKIAKSPEFKALAGDQPDPSEVPSDDDEGVVDPEDVNW